MADSIYNFFNFLEKKAGKTLSPEKNFNLKLKYAKELIDEKDILALPLKTKLIHAPEKIRKEDLTVDGNFDLPRSIKQIPPGLVVKGTLHVHNELQNITDDVQAESVIWKASSDLYPKSFNGATFKQFDISWNKQVTKLPQNIKITGALRAEYSGIETLPEGLKTNIIYLQYAKNLKQLPTKLECNTLDISDTPIEGLPEGLVVHERLDISKLPKKYPQHLEDVIAVDGGATLGKLKEFDKVPQISVNIGKKVKKGKGIAVPLANLDNKEFTNFIDKYKRKYREVDAIIEGIVKIAQGAGRVFNVDLKTVYVFAKHQKGFELEVFLQGKDTNGRELLVSDDAIISAEGQASTKQYNYNWNPTERQLTDAMDKLFPQSTNKEKPVNIRTLMNGPQADEVYWRIGRKTRGGFGIQGQAKDLIPSLSGISQDNMIYYAKKNGVTWGEMMVFDNNGAINVIARSTEKNKDGNYVYFDKYGYGQGGGSRTFEGPDYQEVK